MCDARWWRQLSKGNFQFSIYLTLEHFVFRHHEWPALIALSVVVFIQVFFFVFSVQFTKRIYQQHHHHNHRHKYTWIDIFLTKPQLRHIFIFSRMVIFIIIPNNIPVCVYISIRPTFCHTSKSSTRRSPFFLISWPVAKTCHIYLSLIVVVVVFFFFAAVYVAVLLWKDDSCGRNTVSATSEPSPISRNIDPIITKWCLLYVSYRRYSNSYVSSQWKDFNAVNPSKLRRYLLV